MKTDQIIATLTFVGYDDGNRKTKPYKLAKRYASLDGVDRAEVGSVSIFGDDYSGLRSDVVKVEYSEETLEAAKSVGSPLSVTVAYFDRDELVVAAQCVAGEKEFVVFGAGRSARIVGRESIEIDGEELDAMSVHGKIRSAVGDDGDQLGRYRSLARKKQYEKEKLEEHLARVASAYAEREKRGGMGYKSARVLERCPGGLADDGETRRDYSSRTRSLIADLRSHYEKEMWAICEKTIGKLRCEGPLAYYDGDQYSFVSVAEVAYYVLTRWVREGWGDEIELRKIFAEEFVREYLS